MQKWRVYMVKGLYTAYTGMINEQNRLDILSNNLANADTNGYKKEGATNQTFADELAIKIKDTSSYGMPQKLGTMSMGVHIGETYTDYSQGNFRVTDNATDFALDGDGFFAIAYTDKAGNTSVKYSRDGAFVVNTAGYLVTKDGDYVLNQNGAMNADAGARIQVDPNVPITVDEKGNIFQNNQHFIVLADGVYPVVQGNEAAAEGWKNEVGIFARFNVITTEPAEVFGQDQVDFPVGRVLHQPVESWTIEGCPGDPIITVVIVERPSLFPHIPGEHFLLIFD